MVQIQFTGDELWRRMNRAVEKIQERLEKTAATLEAAQIPYAIIGENAVRAWVAQADEAAVRTTRDVDVLLNRFDLPRAIDAMVRAIAKRACGTTPGTDRQSRGRSPRNDGYGKGCLERW